MVSICFIVAHSDAQSIKGDLFKKTLFSNSIWEANYTKTSVMLKASNEGLVDCGVLCSRKGDHCPLFRFDPLNGNCSLAKAVLPVDWSVDRGEQSVEVYIKEKKIGKRSYI